MTGTLIALTALCFATSALALRADEAKSSEAAEADKAARKRPALTAEQKTLRKELVGKYDANKDGKLDKEERKSFNAEDQAKLKKAGLHTRARKAAPRKN